MTAKEYCLRILKIVVFCAIIVLIYKLLSYAFVDDTESMARVTMHDYYEREGDIDVLFIGPSHMQRGLDANILSEQTGVECFNLATVAQRLSGTYYLAKDAIANNRLTDLYVEFSLSVISSEDDTYSTYIMSDYMKMSPTKIQYLTSVLPEENFTDKWSPLCRTIDITQGLNVEKAVELVNEKRTSEMYNNYLAAPEDYEYMGRGGWNNISEETWGDLMSTQYEDKDFQDFFVTPDSFNKTQMGYLDKIIEECKENNVNLTLMVFPFSDLYIAGGVEEYVESMTYMEQYCSERGVNFVDFNRVSRESLPLTNDCFYDLDHLNEKGAEIFSNFLAEYMQRKADVVWYPTVADRISETEEVYGVIYQRENDWEKAELHFSVTPVTNMEDPVEWTAEVLDGEEVVATLNVLEEYEGFEVDVHMEHMGKTLRLKAVSSEGEKLLTSNIPL